MASRVSRRVFRKAELLAQARHRVFTGQALSQIAFPLGGIGTGTIGLGGYGQLGDVEIFNRPSKGRPLPYTFFAIRAKPAGAAAITRVLEARRHPPYAAGHGLPPAQVWGLPRLASARFLGAYPFATIKFLDRRFPVAIRLEAFNPFIPLNEKDSGLPVAILRYVLRNPGKKPVAVSLVSSMLNPIGFDGKGHLTGRRHPDLGGNRNEYRADDALAGIFMSSSKPAPDDPRFGTMALATTHAGAKSWLTNWAHGAWWDEIQLFWNDFCEDGKLDASVCTHRPSEDGESEYASLACSLRVPPGRTTSVLFLIAWHFPNRINDWNHEPEVRGKILRNWYATQFADAWDVARYVAENLQRLEAQTRRFADALWTSTLPGHVLDAVSSQASVLRTNTCFRTEDGRFFGFEGCSETVGCCPMNCTHVWNYEQTVAHLFPALERTMRLTDFQVNTTPEGAMAFRTLVPLGKRLWNFKPAADGQMGCLLKLYREWQLSGDRAFLESVWPGAKRALEFAFRAGVWDVDADGVMEGEQHNTYDIEFFGPNTMMGTLYLGALRAGEQMARELGDHDAAEQYRKLFERGTRRLDRELWNGQYYEQKGIDPATTKYQFGRGCLSDQLLGQWFCHVVGLGYVLPERRVRRALQAIYQHNFKTSLAEHHSVQRTYALNDEKGLLLCTWPKGHRPPLPFVYADEVWTGIEYQVAAHLIYEGLIEEGLSIVKAVRDRHDGQRRNPWDEFECGHHYVRAMASWSVLLALSGFRYSAPQERIGFEPKLSADDFRCFFSTGSGWGVFAQRLAPKRMTARIEVHFGRLGLRHVALRWARSGRVAKPPAADVRLDQEPVAARVSSAGANIEIELDEPVQIEQDQALRIVLRA